MLSVELILDSWWRCSYLVCDTPWIGLYPVERICIFRLWRRTTLAALDMPQCPTFVWQVSEISNRCPKIIYLFIYVLFRHSLNQCQTPVWHSHDTCRTTWDKCPKKTLLLGGHPRIFITFLPSHNVYFFKTWLWLSVRPRSTGKCRYC